MLRSWRVSILRNRSRYLGDVQATDEKAAEAPPTWSSS
jgi:hypothetical protein